MKKLEIFRFDEAAVRVVVVNGEPWFVSADVCRVLELENPRNVTARLDDDEKGVHIMDTLGGAQEMTVINESGLYSLILTSRKPAAKRFKKWVTNEVLPSIRRTGIYSISGNRLPAFVRRFTANVGNIDPHHFSIIGELFLRVYCRLEVAGYVMPDKGAAGREMCPDISVGKLFPQWLSANHPHLKNRYRLYTHEFPNGRRYPARQYHRDVLSAFWQFVDECWFPEHAERYFGERDPVALEYLPKLLAAPRKKAS